MPLAGRALVRGMTSTTSLTGLASPKHGHGSTRRTGDRPHRRPPLLPMVVAFKDGSRIEVDLSNEEARSGMRIRPRARVRVPMLPVMQRRSEELLATAAPLAVAGGAVGRTTVRRDRRRRRRRRPQRPAKRTAAGPGAARRTGRRRGIARIATARMVRSSVILPGNRTGKKKTEITPGR